MLKFEHIQPGTRIRAYDFQPSEDREPCYVEGVVLRHDNFRGANVLVIVPDVDVFGGEDQEGELSRIGEEVFVPMQVSFMEYDERVQVVEDLK